MTHKIINGWSQAKMIERIWKYNNGKQANNDIHGSSCTYENEEGNRCAVGCFLEPEHLDAIKERALTEASIGGIANKAPELFASCNLPLNLEGLKLLQYAHDSAPGNADIRELLKKWILENTTE